MISLGISVAKPVGPRLWTPMADPLLGDLWDARRVAAGAVSSWPSSRSPGAAVAQGTAANQPTANGTEIAFDGSTDSLARTRQRGRLVSALDLPDAAGGAPGRGFTCTGLARAPDGSWWCGNDGRSVDGDTSYEPSLVHLSADFQTKLGEILLAPLYSGIQSVQGVAFDTSDGTLWFSDLNGNRIRHISQSGTPLSGDITFTAPNGLAYDAGRDMLYVCTTGALSRVTMAGSEDAIYDAGASTWDHLWYDPTLDLVWISWGANGSDGGLVVVNLAEDRIVAEYDLPGSDAIEGIHKDGDTLWMLNDGYFHQTPSARNRAMTYKIQPSAGPVVDIFGLLSVASTTTTDAIICVGNPVAGPGWGLFAADNQTLRIFANTAAGTSERIQVDCAVATLTAMQLVYARIDTDAKTVTVWRNGVARSTTGTTSAVDGILTGHASLMIGNSPDTGARQPAMTVRALGYYFGAGDRLRTQAWMAHQWGTPELLPSDDPYRYLPPLMP